MCPEVFPGWPAAVGVLVVFFVVVVVLVAVGAPGTQLDGNVLADKDSLSVIGRRRSADPDCTACGLYALSGKEGPAAQDMAWQAVH